MLSSALTEALSETEAVAGLLESIALRAAIGDPEEPMADIEYDHKFRSGCFETDPMITMYTQLPDFI